MSNTEMTLNLNAELIGFMNDFNHADLGDCVDFICEKFDISATDELIDEIAEIFFAN